MIRDRVLALLLLLLVQVYDPNAPMRLRQSLLAEHVGYRDRYVLVLFDAFPVLLNGPGGQNLSRALLLRGWQSFFVQRDTVAYAR